LRQSLVLVVRYWDISKFLELPQKRTGQMKIIQTLVHLFSMGRLNEKFSSSPLQNCCLPVAYPKVSFVVK
jgi:hypothetical protein